MKTVGKTLPEERAAFVFFKTLLRNGHRCMSMQKEKSYSLF